MKVESGEAKPPIPLSSIPESGKGRGESDGEMSLEVFGPSGGLIFAKFFALIRIKL